MNNLVILIISIVILIIIFLIILITISKKKINASLIPVEISNDNINNSLKQKYALYKEIINFMKDNLSIKEEAFQEFLNFNKGECTREELINIIDKTTFEINDYVDNYDNLLKNKDFLILKRKLYNVEMFLEAMIDYYNNKLIIYNNLKVKAPTRIACKLFEFEDFDEAKIDKKEISRLINLN